LLLENVEQLNLATEEGVESELADTLRRLEETHVELQLDVLFDKLQHAGYAELSPQEKQQLSQLLSHKHGK